MVTFATPVDPMSLPAGPGSYVLELSLDRQITLRPGKLGPVRLGPGLLRYYGSARGAGGVRSRVARHLRREGRHHWHVDWLLARAPAERVIVELEAGECELVRRDLESGRWAVAAAGFGSSDCRSCPAHLLIG
ncbi:MAG: GIY-YIG nuclease family protein [bacterium]|nr:GIY-YIG nuclease family protein [bacterium]